MLNFAANLSFLFPSRSFPERFCAAAEAGFKVCEFLFPYDHTPDDIAGFLKQAGLTQVLFNLPPGEWAAGERGLAALPGREKEFQSSVDTALRYADATGCRRLHVMAGCVDSANPDARQTFLANLDFAARRLRDAGVTVLIEPINPTDMPGYFLTEIETARWLCCTNQLSDSFYESSVVAGGYEQLVPYEVQDQELAFVQHGAKAARFAINLV